MLQSSRMPNPPIMTDPRIAVVEGGTERLRNPWYPLPQDYPELTEEGQREARVWACSRRDTPTHFVEAWALFRQLYLIPLPAGCFYKTGTVPSPRAHYEWIRDYATYDRVLIGAPRASSKSTIIGKELALLKALTHPFYHNLQFLSTHRQVEHRLDDLRMQLENNEAMINDFGAQKPKRGARVWNLKWLTLANGAIIQGLSIDSRMRGERPHLITLDDPEYDPDNDITSTEFLDDLNRTLFRGMLPMLEEHGKFLWIGTLLSRRSAIYYGCVGDDERFDSWNRRVYTMVHYDEKGRAAYFWKEKWGPRTVARKRKELGNAVWEAECQNNPVAESDRVLNLHDAFNMYTIEGDKVKWRIRGPTGAAEPCEMDYDEWLAGLAVIVTIDAAASVSPTSDFSAILAVGIDAHKTWWILDLFLGRVIGVSLMEAFYKLGIKWGAALAGVESLGFQDQIRQNIQTQVQDRGVETGWMPRVFPLKFPGKLSKADRIGGVLSPRITQHQIRFPAHLRQTWPMQELFKQVEDFTPDLALLMKDDAIDALSFVAYCPRPSASLLARFEDKTDILHQIAEGRTTDIETGLPLMLFINPQTIDLGVLEARKKRLYADHVTSTAEPAQSKIARMGSVLTRPDNILSRSP